VCSLPPSEAASDRVIMSQRHEAGREGAQDTVAQRLFNKVAVVTGASGCLGRAIVQRFVLEGAKLVVFARNAGRLDELASLAPARIVVVSGDVTRPADLEALRDTTVRRMGGIDALVAAAEQVRPANLDECTIDLVDEALAVNFHGALQTIRTLGRHFNSPASIVLVTTSLAHEPRAGWSAFAASKAALSSLSRTLAVELAPRNIRVNCVAPVWHERKEQQFQTAAQAALYLASDESIGVTGQELVSRTSA
jgi:NAD(P)-dependent dehydrogenase (short-subunit alcohol dehydrogenase family)